MRSSPDTFLPAWIPDLLDEVLDAQDGKSDGGYEGEIAG